MWLQPTAVTDDCNNDDGDDDHHHHHLCEIFKTKSSTSWVVSNHFSGTASKCLELAKRWCLAPTRNKQPNIQQHTTIKHQTNFLRMPKAIDFCCSFQTLRFGAVAVAAGLYSPSWPCTGNSPYTELGRIHSHRALNEMIVEILWNILLRLLRIWKNQSWLIKIKGPVFVGVS